MREYKKRITHIYVFVFLHVFQLVKSTMMKLADMKTVQNWVLYLKVEMNKMKCPNCGAPMIKVQRYP